MLLISSLVMVVLTSLLNNKRDNRYIEYKKDLNRISLMILLYVLIINIIMNSTEYLVIGYNIFNNMLMINSINNLIINLILIIGIIYILLISNNVSLIRVIDNILVNKEWLPILVLFNIIGLVLLILVNDLIMLFVIIELQSYSLYLITSIYNESTNSIKGGLFYFIVGSIGSFIILDGTVSIYEEIGLTNIEYIVLFIENINIYDILIILFGLFIKIGLAPFYNYSIVIYTISPTIVTTYISLMPKLSILTLILNLVNIINIVHNNINSNIISIIGLIIFLSMLIGSLGGLNVIKIKTLLAYSSLLNVSYMLLAILSNNNYSLIAYLFYIIQYSITHINLFSIILFIPLYTHLNLLINNNNNIKSNEIIKKSYTVMISKYSPVEYISQLNILFNKNTYLCICLCISLFSLIGIPPLSGFYGKLLVLISSLNNGFILLSISLVLASSISAYYYGSVIKELCFDIFNNYNIFKYNYIDNINLYNLNKFSNGIFSAVSSFKKETAGNKLELLYNNNNNNNDEIILMSNNITYIISLFTLIIILILFVYDNVISGSFLAVINNIL